MTEFIMKTCSEALIVLVCSVVSYLAALLIRRVQNERLQRQLYTALEIGVSTVQETFVTWAKRAAQDGKLTKDERSEAMKKAFETAMEVAENDTVRTALTELSMEEINNIIKNIIAWRKK